MFVPLAGLRHLRLTERFIAYSESGLVDWNILNWNVLNIVNFAQFRVKTHLAWLQSRKYYYEATSPADLHPALKRLEGKLLLIRGPMPGINGHSRTADVLDAGVCDQTWTTGMERRRIPRAALHWTVYLLLPHSSHPFRSRTRDISRDGFYCFLKQPVVPGEHIECDIVVPTHNELNPADMVYLHCHAVVVRVEQTADEHGFGMACRIEDYRVVMDLNRHE